MTPPDPGPGPMLTDQEARAYAHLAIPAGSDERHPGVTISAELARVLLGALDELNERRGPERRDVVTASLAAADGIRGEEDQTPAPLTIAERAAALGRRLDFTLYAGSNLEVAELARAYVELERMTPAIYPDDLEPEETTSDLVTHAAARVRDVVIDQDLGADYFTGRLEELGTALNELGEALDVHESA